MYHSCVLPHTRGVYLKRRVFYRALLHNLREGTYPILFYCTMKGGCLSYSTLLYYGMGACRYSIVIYTGCLLWRQGCHYSTIQVKGVTPIILYSSIILFAWRGGSLFCPKLWRDASIKRMRVSLFVYIVWREGVDSTLFYVLICSYVLLRYSIHGQGSGCLCYCNSLEYVDGWDIKDLLDLRGRVSLIDPMFLKREGCLF